jgi:UDP-glucose 4-epimerase
MKRVLVTGGAGYIGSHTAVTLHEAGYEPVIYDNFSNSDHSAINGIEKIIEKEIQFHDRNMTHDKSHLRQLNVDAIIHFAAHKSVPDSVSRPLEYYQNNLISLMNAIDLARHKNIPIIFSSSCSVYGEPDTPQVTESTPLKPAVSPYGNTKRVCEEILRDASNAYGITGISLRYFNPIGAHPTGLIGELPIGVPGNLVPRLVEAVLNGKEITVFGNDYSTPDGTCIRDYIYVMDLAHAHVSALEYAFENPGVYDVFNVGTGKGTSVTELLDSFESATEQKIKRVIKDRRPGDVVEVFADPSKIKSQLGWEPKYDIEFSLLTAWNWALKIKNHIHQ